MEHGRMKFCAGCRWRLVTHCQRETRYSTVFDQGDDMAFVVRISSPLPSRYVVVKPELRAYISATAAEYDPDMSNATRFGTRDEADAWMGAISGAGRKIEVISVG
jgi:hypothetical protein